LRFDFSLATKHCAVHYLHATLRLPPQVIAERMGWSLEACLIPRTLRRRNDVRNRYRRVPYVGTMHTNACSHHGGRTAGLSGVDHC
jgi:hypothetical protein